jgi:hypothetical protein
MGFFHKLFGKPEREAEPEPESPVTVAPPVAAVGICRHGMNVPSADELAQVIALAFPDGLAPTTQTVGLSQPSWFKNQEIAESAAADVAAALRHKLGLGEGSHTHRILERDGAAKILIVEVYQT